jgi:hypothetical protein
MAAAAVRPSPPAADVVLAAVVAPADLATFDSEAVARAIASCPVPVVTGLGEVDRSVADEVACLASRRRPPARPSSWPSPVPPGVEACGRPPRRWPPNG